MSRATLAKRYRDAADRINARTAKVREAADRYDAKAEAIRDKADDIEAGRLTAGGG